MPKHKIAIISTHTSPLAKLGTGDAGGMNVYVRELSRALCPKGFEIDIFTRAQAPSRPTVVNDNGARIIYLKAGPLTPYPKELLPRYFQEFLAKIVSFATAGEYGLIHSHHWLSGWVATRLKNIWKVPLIHTFHTLGSLKPSTRYRLQIETHTAEEADSIISTSLSEKNQLVQYYNADSDKIHVLPCGVNLKLFRRLEPGLCKEYLGLPQQSYLLFVGRIDPIKSIETLLKAMRRLDSAAHLLIIGGEDGNSELQSLRKMTGKLGITDKVSFLRAKPQTILPYYYSAAEMCILPSRYESFGLVTLEAMACGTPVIASRVGGIPEVVEDGKTGFLITPGDEKEIADRIDCLLRDERLRNFMVSQARKRARKFSWKSVADKVSSVYEAYAN